MPLENIALPSHDAPVLLAWPCDGNAGGFLQFDEPELWRAFVTNLAIHPLIPAIVSAKFARAQMLYLLGWIDFSVVKAGELAALVALELALTDRYSQHFRPRKPTFAGLLRHMVEADDLTDADTR